MPEVPLELYWGSGSIYAWRVMLALLFKDLDYTDHLLSFSDREHKQAGYTALNPRGKVPTLVDGEVVVSESIAILAYLDHVYRRNPLFGASGHDAARIWRQVMEIESYLVSEGQPVIRALFRNRWIHQVDVLKAHVTRAFGELDRLEVSVATGPFTAADCMWVPLVESMKRASMKAGASNVGLLPFPLGDRWPGLAARLEAIEALDGFERTYPPHWR